MSKESVQNHKTHIGNHSDSGRLRGGGVIRTYGNNVVLFYLRMHIKYCTKLCIRKIFFKY